MVFKAVKKKKKVNVLAEGWIGYNSPSTQPLVNLIPQLLQDQHTRLCREMPNFFTEKLG